MDKKMVTIVTELIDGSHLARMGSITGYVVHGYDLETGGWSLYPITGKATPAEFLQVRWEKKRKPTWINKKFIVKIIE